MKQTRVRATTLTAAIAVMVAAIAVPASGETGPDDGEIRVSPGLSEDVGEPGGFDDVGLLTLPPIPDEMLMEATALNERIGTHPQVASVGIALDRSGIEIYWYGPRTPELDAEIGELEAPVSVLASTYSPEELRGAAAALRAGEAGVEVAVATPRADGSGLDVSLLGPQPGLRARSDRAAAEQAVREFAGVPVTFSGPPMTAATSRLSDTAHMAGGRIHRYENGYIMGSCTSAFAVIRPETGQKGLFTAAHCGDNGSTWVIHDGVEGSNSYYMLGTVVNRDVWTDSEVIDSTWSYPYMYTGSYTSGTYTAINGLVNPVIGTEICYSGSYTGLQCGNIVTALEQPIDYRSQISYAFTTTNNAGLPTVGQGDSGGPGYVLTSTPNGYKRYAATIISGIYDGSSSCMGYVYPGRMCSSVAYSTSVSRALGATGWALQTLP